MKLRPIDLGYPKTQNMTNLCYPFLFQINSRVWLT